MTGTPIVTAEAVSKGLFEAFILACVQRDGCVIGTGSWTTIYRVLRDGKVLGVASRPGDLTSIYTTWRKLRR